MRTQRGFCFRAIVSIAVVVTVASALIAENTRRRGPHVELADDYSLTWQLQTTTYGWPFAYYVHTRSVDPRYDWSPELILGPKGLNDYTWILIADVSFAVLIVISTVCVAVFWAKSSNRAFQFQIRHMLLATVLVSVVLAVSRDYRDVFNWVVAIPLAFGVLCLPISVGLLFYRVARKCDSASRRQYRNARSGKVTAVL